MPKQKIVVISDMDFIGSGYFYLMTPLLTGLAKLGYEIKVAGLGYKGTEHDFPFSIIPVQTIQDAHAVANNLVYLWGADLFLVGMDPPIQQFFFENLAALKKKYIAITPIENGPLTMSWAATFLNMDSVFFISELGKQEALKVGVSKAEHLMVGVDSVTWHPATKTEKSTLRKGLGISEDALVILTVADNQERKNLWATMSAVSLLKKEIERPIKYIIVTREGSPVGWRLRDLALSLNLNQELMIFERGIPIRDLWGLYAISDIFLIGSKAEGLGMPVLEAMASGIPVVANDTGALHEILDNYRGFLVPSEYSFIDVWGNSKRDMMNIKDATKTLKALSDFETSHIVEEEIVGNALKYARSRTWDVPVNQLDKKIQEIFNGQK